jgi:tetratricopeptide (TPR) repeat protein
LTTFRKSQLAIECCYRARERSPDCWVFWIHASSPERLKAGLRELADDLQLPERHGAGADILQIVERWLRGSGSKWLLVLDNADLEDVLFRPVNASNPALPNASKKGTIDYLAIPSCGQTILTTRYNKVALQFVDDCNVITVGPMVKSDAITLFQNKAGKHHYTTHVERLVDALGHIPLAIAHAAAFIKRKVPHCTVQTYLDELQKTIESGESLLTANYNELRRDDEANNSVINTWQISFEHVRQTRPSAADCLSLMSFYDHRSIPRLLLRRRDSAGLPPTGLELAGQSVSTEADIDGDILILYEFHLITIGVGSEDLELHPLVHMAVRKWLKSQAREDQWLRASIENLRYALPEDTDEFSPQWGILLPHFQLALTYELSDKTSGLCLADVCERMNRFIAFRDLGASINWLRRCLTERTCHLGNEHILTLKAELRLIRMLTGLGVQEALEEARTLLKYCSPLAEKYSDSSREWKVFHAQCLHATGESEALQGHLADAETSFRRALESFDEHPEQDFMPTCVNSLKKVLLKQAKQLEAETVCRQVLETCIKAYGSEHKHTVHVTVSLADVLYTKDDLVEALEMYKGAFEAYKHIHRVYGPETLSIMSKIAKVLQAQNEMQEAVDLMEQAYRMSSDRYGEESIVTLIPTLDYVIALRAAGELHQALDLMRVCATNAQGTLGPGHRGAITSARLVTALELELREAQESQIAQGTQDAQQRQDELKRQGRKRKRGKRVNS